MGHLYLTIMGQCRGLFLTGDLANVSQLFYCAAADAQRSTVKWRSTILTRLGGHSSHQGEMWRSTVFSEHENSDQSISEDDDLDGDLPEDHVSLGIPAEEKGKVQILSQLHMLRGTIYEDANEVSHERDETSLPQKRQADISVEDDVELEFPFFVNKSKFTFIPQGTSACNSDEEILSDNDEGNCLQLDNYEKVGPSSFRENRKDRICTWLAENTETDSFCPIPISTTVKRSCKGGQVKPKHKFTFRTQFHNNHLQHDFSEGSSVKYNKTKSTSEQLAENKSIVSITHTFIEEDDPDCLVSDSSEEDEEKHQIQGLKVVVHKQKTIADQFHEALGASSINEEGKLYAISRNTGFGLFGKLQCVMQKDKERDLYFLNKLQKEDEASIDVKILSKSLEGKLTVCSCSSIDNDEQTCLADSTRKKLTIIFSSRVCADVELDVGVLIRIHFPWKEVKVKGKQENTILSTYYSPI